MFQSKVLEFILEGLLIYLSTSEMDWLIFDLLTSFQGWFISQQNFAPVCSHSDSVWLFAALTHDPYLQCLLPKSKWSIYTWAQHVWHSASVSDGEPVPDHAGTARSVSAYCWLLRGSEDVSHLRPSGRSTGHWQLVGSWVRSSSYLWYRSHSRAWTDILQVAVCCHHMIIVMTCLWLGCGRLGKCLSVPPVQSTWNTAHQSKLLLGWIYPLFAKEKPLVCVYFQCDAHALEQTV